MALGAIIGAAGSILGGLFGANQAGKAAQAQTDAANRQIDVFQGQYDDTRNLLAPYVAGGGQANAAYLHEMGLGPRPTVGGVPAAVRTIPGTSGTPGQPGTGGGVDPYQLRQARARAESLGGEYAREYESLLARSQRGGTAGTGGTPTLYEVNGQRFGTLDEANAFAGQNRTGGQAYGGFTKTPGYDFRLSQGMDALESSAAARGRLFSGATMKAATEYGQDYATSQYEPYLNRLGGLAQGGQAAAAGQALAGNQFAQNTATALGSIGDARSAGAIAKGNAWSDGIDNAISAYSYFNNKGPRLGGNARYIGG